MTLSVPYQGYKGSKAPWVGRLPAHWDEKPLFAVARERSAPNTGMRENNLLSLSYGRVIRKDIDTNQGLLPESFETYQIIERGDIVLRLTDLQNDQKSLRTGRCEERGIITSAYTAVIPEKLDSRFFDYLMRSYDTQKAFYSMGGGLRQSLNYADIRRVPIPVPSANEQRQIVGFLNEQTSQIDKLIERKRSFIELLGEKSLAIAAHGVTGGFSRTNHISSDAPAWLGRIPSRWRTVRIAEIFRETVRAADTNLPVLAVSIHHGVSDKELDNEERARKVNLSEDRTKYQRVQPGDLVYNMMRAWQGGFGTVTVDGLVSPAYVVAEPKAEFRTKFIELQLRTASGAEEVRRYSKGIADFRQRLYWEHFRNLKVCLPPLKEQDEIIAHIESEQARLALLKTKTERSIELLREHRTALITAAVTGKIDVRNAA